MLSRFESFNPRCDGEYSWIPCSTTACRTSTKRFNPRCDGEYSWIECKQLTKNSIFIVSIPDVMGNTAEWHCETFSCILEASFNPRCDGEYSWITFEIAVTDENLAVSIPDVMGNTAEWRTSPDLSENQRRFQSPMWWGIQLNLLPVERFKLYTCEFQSPMWWGIQLNLITQTILWNRVPRFQSPMWWGIQLNIARFAAVTSCLHVSIPDVMGNTAEFFVYVWPISKHWRFQSPMWWGIQLN